MGSARIFRHRTVARPRARPTPEPTPGSEDATILAAPATLAGSVRAPLPAPPFAALLLTVTAVLLMMVGATTAGAQVPTTEETGPAQGDGAAITGTVGFGNGDPAVGVKISLFTTRNGAARDRYLRPAFTDGDGRYRFDDLAADCYSVLIEAPIGASFEQGAGHREHLSCVDPGQRDDSLSAVLTSGRPGKPFQLNLLHIGDHHSHLEPSNVTLKLGDETSEVEVGGMARAVAKIRERERELGPDNTITIHSGDALSGTILYTVFGGAADAAAMNSVCFDLLGVGRQDVAHGQERLQTFLDFLADDTHCRTEALTADPIPLRQPGLDQPSIYRDWAGQRPLEPMIGPVTVRSVGQGAVGFVTVPTLAGIGPVVPDDELAELAATAQASIDLLKSRGITNVVLISNIGLVNDMALVPRLTDVDAVVGGGSHTLLGDFESLGLEPAGRYPQPAVNRDGDPVCISHAWHYARVVGELRVDFDGNGVASSCDGEAHLLLPTVEPDPETAATIDGFVEGLAELSRRVLGTVTEELCYTRVPSRTVGLLCSADVIGDASRRPADIQLMIAEAVRSRAGDAQIGLVNAGIVGHGLPAGPLEIDATYRLLAGDHAVVRLTMTGAEIAAAVEEAVENALDDENSSSPYPHAAGLRWTYDPAAPAGSRVGALQVRAVADTAGDDPSIDDTSVTGGSTERWEAVDPGELYTVATIGYLADGGDGYTVFAAVSADGRGVRTHLEYTQVLVDYIDDDLGGRISPAGRWKR